MIFPYIKGEKERPNPTRQLREDERRFYFTSGMKPPLYNVQEAGRRVVFLCEGETDTLRLWQAVQEAGLENVGVVGLSGVDTWNDLFAVALKPAKHVYALLDNDTDYMVKAQVDSVWRDMRRVIGRKARRISLPSGTKDVCEFFETFDLDTLRDLAKRSSGKSRYKPLDLSKTPPKPNWLLEGLIAKADFTVVAAREGMGKSWITMKLTKAVADGDESCLGLPVKAHGRVLYVDQENPEDVIFTRLRQLGLENRDNVRYLYNQGIKFNREEDFDTFLDEALDFEPEFIAIDSLTATNSGKEENSAGEMARLSEAFQQLARETGAAVVLIHHHDKGANGPRGSGAISSTADTVIDLFREGSGQFSLRLSKSRRRLGGDAMVVTITDMPDGSVDLLTTEPLEPPF